MGATREATPTSSVGRGPRWARAWVALAAFAASGACASREPCISSRCARGEVCGFGGACGPLEDSPVERVASPRWLFATEWGVTRASTGGRVAPASDAIEIGGARDARAHLRFDGLPTEGTLVRALLFVAPHPMAAPLRAPMRILVERTGDFHSASLTRRHMPEPFGLPLADRSIAEGARLPQWIDVTGGLALLRRARDTHITLSLRSADSTAPSLSIASPTAFESALRPRLELLLR